MANSITSSRARQIDFPTYIEQKHLSATRENSSLFRAISVGDLTNIKTRGIGKQYGDINAHLSSGETPLLFAIALENASSVHKLLDLGADIHLEGAYYGLEPDVMQNVFSRWISPIQAVVEQDNVEMMDAILDRVTVTEPVTINSYTMLRMYDVAIKQRAKRLLELISTKCSSKPKNCFEPLGVELLFSRLYAAIENDFYEGVRFLLDKFVSANGREGHYPTPIVAAGLRGNVEICTLLTEKGAHLDQVNRGIFDYTYGSYSKKKDPLIQAIYYGSVAAAELLLSLGSHCKCSVKLEPLRDYIQPTSKDDNDLQRSCPLRDGFPLHLAVIVNNLPMVKFLIERCAADLDATDSQGNTPLHAAAMMGDARLIDELFALYKHQEKDVVHYAAQRNNNGQTPLRCLLGLNLVNFEYRRLKHYARIDAVRTFLKWRIDFQQESDQTCEELLGIAISCNRRDIIFSAVECGLQLKRFIEKPCYERHQSPTSLAAYLQSVDILKLFLELGANVNQTTELGDTVLHHAISCKSEDYLIEVFNVLEQAGIDWNAVNQRGFTVLHQAVRKNRSLDIIRFCLEKCRQKMKSCKEVLEDSSVLNLALEFNGSGNIFSVCKLLVTSGVMLPDSTEFYFRLGSLCHCDDFTMEMLLIAGCDLNSPRHESINRAFKGRYWWLVRMLLASADSSNVSSSPYVTGLKRLPKHRNEVVNAMLTLAHTPPSLSHLARRVVRQQLIKHTRGASIIPAAFKLPLPLMLQQYILLSDVRRCNIETMSTPVCVFSAASVCAECEKSDEVRCTDSGKCQHHRIDHATEFGAYSTDGEDEDEHSENEDEDYDYEHENDSVDWDDDRYDSYDEEQSDSDGLLRFYLGRHRSSSEDDDY